MSPHEIEEILYEALHSTAGVLVETNNPPALRAKLYAARRANADFAPLSIHLSPLDPNGALFVVKGTSDAPQSESPEAHP